MTSSLYHGGGGGGGPGPGVCGSPTSSRARRFHFPGCPGVNIRVSAPLPPRRAAATFLPRPGRARARPPRSRLSANERAGPRRSPSMELGAGGRSADRGSEGRGLRADPRGGWRSGRAQPGRVSAPRVADQPLLVLTPGVGFSPHPDPAVCSENADTGGGRGTVPAGLLGGMRKALGLGGVSPSPPHPVHALTPAADPELVRPAGPSQPGESVVSEREKESQRCR